MKKIIIVLLMIFSHSYSYGTMLYDDFDYQDKSEFDSSGNWEVIPTNVTSYEYDINPASNLKVSNLTGSGTYHGVYFKKALANPTYDFVIQADFSFYESYVGIGGIVICLYNGDDLLFRFYLLDHGSILASRFGARIYDENGTELTYMHSALVGGPTYNNCSMTITRTEETFLLSGSYGTVIHDLDIANNPNFSKYTDLMAKSVDSVAISFTENNNGGGWGSFDNFYMEYEGSETVIPEPLTIISFLTSILCMIKKRLQN